MSMETHVNTLLQDVNQAKDDLLSAVHAYAGKVETLKNHLMHEAGMVGHAAEVGVEEGVKAAEKDYSDSKVKEKASSAKKS